MASSTAKALVPFRFGSLAQAASWFRALGDETRLQIIDRLSEAMVKIVALPEVKAKLNDLGADAVSSATPEQFGRHKRVRLQFAEEDPQDDWARFGEVTRKAGPELDLQVDRARVSEVLAALLDRHTVLDVSVQDPPLDQVIAHVFEQGKKREVAHEPG